MARLQRDPRLAGVAVGGSIATGTADEFSDIDLRIAVEPGAWEQVNAARREIAAGLGHLLAAFTGEHVGEPRLLICLYGPEPLHVDLMFARVDDLEGRIDEPAVLWQRDDRFRDGLAATDAVAPTPDLQWIEDRFWIWVHYGATKVARGELFEAMDFLAYLRGQVLGPMALQAAGARPAGVRKVEAEAPEWIGPLAATVAAHDRAACWRALSAAVSMYEALLSRLDPESLKRGVDARRAAIDYCRRLGAAAFDREPCAD